MRLPAALLLAIFLVSCAHLAPPKSNPLPPPTEVIQPVVEPVEVRVERSIGRITGYLEGKGSYVCTAFSIAPRKYLTAAHCTYWKQRFPQLDLRVGGAIASVVAQDLDLDLAVLVVDLEKPALPISFTSMKRWQKAYGLGFGEGLRTPTFTEHRVLSLDYDLGGGLPHGILYQSPFIGGMSGGPVFDADGVVVGMVQRASYFIGYGVDAPVIQLFLLKGEHFTGKLIALEMEREMAKRHGAWPYNRRAFPVYSDVE